MGQIGVYMCTIECWWCGSKRVMQRLNEYAGWNNQHTNVSHFKKQMMTIISFSGSDFNDIIILLECTCSNDHKNKNPAQRNEEVADRGDRHIHGKELKCFNYDESNYPEGRRLWHHDKRSGLCIAAAKSDSGLQCNEESADRDDQHIHGQALQRLPFSWALRRSKTKNAVMSRMYSRIRPLFPNQTFQISDVPYHTRWSRFGPGLDIAWAMVANILLVWHHSSAGWCSQLCQRWSYTKKMRKPVRSQKDYKSYTKFRTGEGMMMAQTVAELGARFKAWRGPWTTVCDRPQSR